MRLSRLLTLSLLVALAFSACGTGSPTSATATTAATDQPVIKGTASPSPSPVPSLTPTLLPTLGVAPAALRGVGIQAWQAFSGPAADLFTSQVAQFNASNQWGIVVTPSGYGDYPSLLDAMNAALEKGNAPDLVAALPEQTLVWETLGQVVDLQPYLSDPQWGLGTEGNADIPSIFWAQDNVNGKQLGVPAERSARLWLTPPRPSRSTARRWPC